MDQLFDSKELPDDEGAALASESSSHYLRRSTRPRWQLLRKIFTDWYSRYPNKHRSDLFARFNSDDNTQHYGAFFELYCHELLVRHGYAVDVHPEGDPTKSTVPDFLATHGSLGSLYLEATIAVAQADMRRDEQRISTLVDAINALPLPGYCLSFSIREVGKATPSTKKVLAFLRNKHQQLHGESSYSSACYDHVYTDDSWVFHFAFIPVSVSLSQTIGIHHTGVFYDDISVPLQRSLGEKSPSKYGDLPFPFVVAVDSIDTIGTEHKEVAKSLIGMNNTSQSNTAWGAYGSFRREGHSALFFIEGLLPWTIFSESPTVWLNPGAARPLPPNSLGLSRYELVPTESDEWKGSKGVAINELLGIPAKRPKTTAATNVMNDFVGFEACSELDVNVHKLSPAPFFASSPPITVNPRFSGTGTNRGWPKTAIELSARSC